MDLILRRVNTCKGAHGSLLGPDPSADTLMDEEQGPDPKQPSFSSSLHLYSSFCFPNTAFHLSPHPSPLSSHLFTFFSVFAPFIYFSFVFLRIHHSSIQFMTWCDRALISSELFQHKTLHVIYQLLSYATQDWKFFFFFGCFFFLSRYIHAYHNIKCQQCVSSV